MVLWKLYDLKSWKMPLHVYWQRHLWQKCFYYDNLTVKNSNEEERLGLTLDRKLTFHQHCKKMCRKAGQELSAILRLSPYLDTNKRKIICTTMVKSQINYYPLVWMFCTRRSSNLINKVQERALRIIFNDKYTDFKSLLWNHYTPEKCTSFNDWNI